MAFSMTTMAQRITPSAALSNSPTSASATEVCQHHAGLVSVSSTSSSLCRPSSQSILSSSHHCSSSRGLLFSRDCSSRGRGGVWKPRQERRAGAVCMVLPTGNPVKEGEESKGRGAEGGRPKWSARAIKSFSMAELEARKLKYPTTGTEALLMGILTEGTSHGSRFLRANGVTLFGVRDQTVKILGKADMYFFSPEHPPLTEQAQKALDWAIEEEIKRGGDKEVTTALMVLGIWAQKGSAGQKVLEALAFDDKKAFELLDAETKPLALT